ncbi:MAG: hypothetical protein WCE75_04930 [Terracidiphilus sp.]
MTNELLQAAVAAVRRSSGPMTVSQIRTAVSRELKVPNKDRFAAEIRSGLPGTDGISVWPEFGRSPVFCSRPLAACAEEALLRALEQEPLTAAKAGAAVKKALRYVSETRILKEVKVLLGRMTASGAVIRLAAGRQSGMYLARTWMAKQARMDGGELFLRRAIPLAVARIQSGPGNYVRVDQLRAAPEIRAIFDQAVIELADRRELVLAHFDGPYPVPEERKQVYVEDGKGELFVGVALPRD